MFHSSVRLQVKMQRCLLLSIAGLVGTIALCVVVLSVYFAAQPSSDSQTDEGASWHNLNWESPPPDCIEVRFFVIIWDFFSYNLSWHTAVSSYLKQETFDIKVVTQVERRDVSIFIARISQSLCKSVE